MTGIEIMLKSMGIDPQMMIKYGEEARSMCRELLASLDDIRATSKDTNVKVSAIYSVTCHPAMGDDVSADYINQGLVKLDYNPEGNNA